MTETLTASDLWIDGKQGIGRNDCAFGYIGTDEGTQDEDGDDCEYYGWFFEWPGATAKITSEAEREQVIASLELDPMADSLPSIPHELAVERLTAYLDKKYPNNLDD